VAGQFYPAQRDELHRTLADLFARAPSAGGLGNVVAVISPHAGYVFSGEVAAAAFRQVDPDCTYENVFILASSHRMAFEGASLYVRGNLLTPLGTVAVDRGLCRKLIDTYDVFVDRPEAHADEHSLEVQLPFLQYHLKKDFRVVPLVIGAQNEETCRKIARALNPYFRSGNLFVVSTDFSHYPSSRDAHDVDAATARAIASNSPAQLMKTLRQNEEKGIPNLATSLCGWSSVLTLLYMTERNPDAAYHLVAYRNSGDSPYSGKDQVVGYHAIAVTLRATGDTSDFRLSAADRKTLLSLARKTLVSYITTRTVEDPAPETLSEAVKSSCGAFVTLEKHGDLRGCIGQFEPAGPLYKVVQDMAIAAAVNDPRFPPVSPEELKQIEIEISVLTPLKRIRSIDEFTLGKHGIYIRKGMRSGTFLPQVAEQTGWTKEEFLGHCAQDKAGIGWNGWKDAELYVYEAIVFSERELNELH
jgi:AmmeMemoRadiSam system protein B/AmmeMemoRadiSam system protein A